MKKISLNNSILLLALIRFILPYLIQSSYYQPHRDEYLYLAEGRHLAWGFMEVPPLMSILAYITNVLGGNMFWIKFWPALTGSLVFALMSKIIVSLGGRLFSVFLLFLCFTLTGYLRLFFLFHPNFLDVFFWTLISFCAVRYIQLKQNKWLYAAGISIGLGLLSKYSTAFYVSSLFVGILLTRQRVLLKNRHFYFALIVALFMVIPNIIWQYNHRWPVMVHMDELQNQQLKFVNPVNFIIGQAVMFLPCVFIWIAGLLWISFRPAGGNYRLFSIAYVALIIILLFFHGKDYYAAGIYPVLFAFGCYALEKISVSRFRFLRFIVILLPISIGLTILPVLLPTGPPERLADYYHKLNMEKTGALRWEDQKNHPLPQDFADMVGWKETAIKAGNVYNNLPDSEKARTIIFCNQYYFAGALTYYRRVAGLPEIFSNDASFLLWLPDSFSIKNLILIDHHLPDKPRELFKQFQFITVKDSLNNPLARENGIKIILCGNAAYPVNSLLQKALASQKAQFTR